MNVEAQIQKEFFEYLFGEQKGYLCIATKDAATDRFQNAFFHWPGNEAVSYIQEVQSRKDVYFCVHLLDAAKRVKRNALPTRVVWADLDTQVPDEVEPQPSAVLETSPGRYHAFWRMARTIEPTIAEDYSRRIAYSLGKIDTSGWDLTQVLRVPLTTNHKYADKPQVRPLPANEEFIPFEDFEKLPIVAPSNGDVPDEMPEAPELSPPTPIIERHKFDLQKTRFFELYNYDAGPDEDWSTKLWALINSCLEAGLSAEETFILAYHSSVNKYKRDNRPPQHLWRDVIKANQSHIAIGLIFNEYATELVLPELFTAQESKALPKYWTDEYVKWATKSTDAPAQFHAFSSLIGLSSVMSSCLRLETSHGTIIPNLWGMILGDTTVTRKTTAMRFIEKMLVDIDPDLILATDGSQEGILSALSLRSKKSSMFYRDEVSGFFRSATRRESYQSGILEMFTQLYDSPPMMTRILRQSTFQIKDPVFLFFGGGIEERVTDLLDEDYILSGFLPRFLIVSGESETWKPTGPPVSGSDDERGKILGQLREFHDLYNAEGELSIGNQSLTVPRMVQVELTNETWQRYGEIERQMIEQASDSHLKLFAVPTFDRLSKSLLKIAMLLSASRQTPDNGNILMEEKDLIKASVLIQDWGRYSIRMMEKCGVVKTEKIIRRILERIRQNPGILRGQVMRMFRLNKREADDIFGTLIERGEITTSKQGKGTQLWVT